MTTAEEQSPTPIGQLRWTTLGVVCFLFCSLNFLGMLVFGEASSALLMASVFGAVSAELALTATWAVFGPGPALWRFSGAFLVTIGLGLVFLGSFALFLSPPKMAEFFALLLFLPAVFLAAQVPLWLLRFIRGHQLVDLHQSKNDRPLAARQFGVAHLLGAITIVAGTIGAGNSAVQLRGSEPLLVWSVLAVVCGVVIVYIVLTTLLLFLAVFSPRENCEQAITWFVLCTLFLGLGESTLVAALGSPVMMAFLTFHAALVFATAVPFGLLRWLGYRLDGAGKTVTAGHVAGETEEETIDVDPLAPKEMG